MITKVIFFDIDGTLISFRTHTMPQSTLEALHTLRSRGIKLFVATGRAPVNIDFIKKLFDFDGYVTCNGQYCHDSQGEVIYERAIDKSDIRAIVSHLKKSGVACNFVEADRTYYNLIDQSVLDLSELVGSTTEEFTRVEQIERALHNNVYQVSIFADQEQELENLRHMPTCKAVRWYPTFMDVIAADGGKPTGLRKVMEHYGFTHEQAMAFGDGGNDIEMLAYAHMGVAMGNARDEVKAVADYITDDVDSDGLAKALHHFGLI